MTRGLPLHFVLLSCCWALGCNSILGIEEAQVDPRLEISEDALDPAGLVVAEQEAPDAGAEGTDDVTPSTAPVASATDTEMRSVEEQEATDSPSPEQEDSGVGESDESDELDDAEESDQRDEDDAAERDAGASAEDEDESENTTLCQRYCEEIMDLCTDELAQYRDMAQCLTVCEYFPEGELTSEENENTVACRLRHASKARYAAGTEHEAYCRQAGPGGDGFCGSNCESFCTLMMGVCTEDSAEIYHFGSEDQCLETCNALPVSDVTYSTNDVEVADGNHVQCRLFHVTSAAMLDPEEHCEHSMGLTLCEAPDEAVGAEAL